MSRMGARLDRLLTLFQVILEGVGVAARNVCPHVWIRVCVRAHSGGLLSTRLFALDFLSGWRKHRTACVKCAHNEFLTLSAFVALFPHTVSWTPGLHREQLCMMKYAAAFDSTSPTREPHLHMTHAATFFHHLPRF